jgi:flavin-binding protein dodecin
LLTGSAQREPPADAFAVERRGISHYLQPHAFLPRGRRLLSDWAPDVLDALLDAGAEVQDLALKLDGARERGDEDLVYLWVRRPIIEWALRRAAAAEPAVEMRTGVQVSGLLMSTPLAGAAAAGDGAPRCARPSGRTPPMTDNVYSISEIVGTSPDGVDQAIRNAITRASRTLRNLDWFEVAEVRGYLSHGEIDHFQVRLKVGFRLD